MTIRFPFLSGVSSDVIDCQPLRSFAHRFAVIRVPRLFKFACGEQAGSSSEMEKSPVSPGSFLDFYSAFIRMPLAVREVQPSPSDSSSAAVTSGAAVSQVFRARHLRAVLWTGESRNCGHGGDRQGDSQCDFADHGLSPLLFVDNAGTPVRLIILAIF